MRILYESTSASSSCLAGAASTGFGVAGLVIAVAALFYAMYRRNPKGFRSGIDPRTLGITAMLAVLGLALVFASGSVDTRVLALDGSDLVRRGCNGAEAVEERIPQRAITSRSYRRDDDTRFTPPELRDQLVIELGDGRRIRMPLVANGSVNDFDALVDWAPDAMARYGVTRTERGEPVPVAVQSVIPGPARPSPPVSR